ncbi:site-specific DNA-methyltransferase [Megamonas hypermegale]|uniref:site-specific DNA-methyltransferase n=1 Tax=Megamonas hypermegale TaxID=158847 RepID=UPI0026EF6707|nr:site-specific DNA-methyltransferase [Megamonas hypermegale]
MPNKLELTWYGKDEEIKVEPRLLIENKELSNCNDENCENMLIHGDNLLALKALENKFTGKVKCIYIDPPYNTGAAFEHYDDNLEHSIWLNLMYKRLQSLKNLLSEDGIIAIEIDDTEMPYLRIILDELFGRNKFIAQINVRSNSISGAKTAHKNKTILRNKDNIILYKKSNNIVVHPQYIKKEDWDTHYNYFLEYDSNNNPINILKLKDVLINSQILKKGETIKKSFLRNPIFYDFIISHKKNIFRFVNSISDSAKRQSKANPNTIIKYKDDNGIIRFAYNGSRISLLEASIIKIDDEEIFAQLLGDLWTDIDFQNTQNEGGVSFPSNKKPEALIRRILDLFTEENDLVLDSFLGSGTTAAVAHKMKRKWIGIELGNHCYTHCKTRLDRVIDGKDVNGISKKVNWRGGGGYKFYELAPTLIKEDAFGEPIINKEYNPEMLASAVALHEGFEYQPSKEIFWKQSKGNENSYLFVTTKYVTKSYIENIAISMQDNEYLIIACKSFDKDCDKSFKNIKVKKIPQMLLNKCEFNKDDYNLNIIHPPVYDYEENGECDE